MGELGVQERILTLRRVPVLRLLPTPVILELAHSIEIEPLRRGDLLFREGAVPPGVAWVIDGQAQWTCEDRVLGDVAAGANLGLLEVLARAAATFSVRAQTPLTVARLATDRFAELLEDSFDLAHGVLAAIAGDLCASGRSSLERGACLDCATRAPPHDLEFTERLVRLRMSRPFGRAPIRSLAALALRGSASRWPRGARLWRRGSEARSFAVILAGEVRVGNARLHAGDTAGLLEALASRRRSADAIVRAPVTAIAVELDTLIDVLEDDDDFALEMLRACADELLELRRERGAPPDIVPTIPDRSLPAIGEPPDLELD